MHTIHWTIREEEDCCHAMAISVSDMFGFNVTFGEDSDIHPTLAGVFPTKDEAVHYITQLNKPNYYERYKLNYELVYVDMNSDEWKESFTKYENTMNLAEDLKEFVKLPFYKKIFKKKRIKKMAEKF